MVGGRGQLAEQSEFTFEPAYHAGSDRQTTEKKNVDRDQREGRSGESVRAKPETHIGGNYRVSGHFGHGERSSQGMVL